MIWTDEHTRTGHPALPLLVSAKAAGLVLLELKDLPFSPKL